MSERNKGLLMQIAGVVVLLAGLRGFFVIEGGVAYFIGYACMGRRQDYSGTCCILRGGELKA
jgi:hypothetical protein